MDESDRGAQESTRDYARRLLREDITSMHLRPGEKVSENELAQKYGVSRTPVREALMDLARYQVVEVLPQRGSRISLIDFELVEEARQVRELMELAILPLACARATEEDIRRLRHNVHLQQLTEDESWDDTLSLMDLDNEFHRLLFKIARRENMQRLLQDISIHFDRVRSLTLEVVKERKLIADHLEICDAVARRDADYACEKMKKHLNRVHLDARRVMEVYPQYIAGNAPRG